MTRENVCANCRVSRKVEGTELGIKDKAAAACYETFRMPDFNNLDMNGVIQLRGVFFGLGCGLGMQDESLVREGGEIPQVYVDFLANHPLFDMSDIHTAPDLLQRVDDIFASKKNS